MIKASVLESLDFSKNLVVIIDKHLRFEKHINKLLQKVYSTIKLIYSCRQFSIIIKILLCES